MLEEDQTLLRTGVMRLNASYSKESFEGYITHPQCPLNYCTKKTVHINLNNPDEQCRPNRQGLLCSTCKDDISLILGSSQCKKCNNKYLAFLIPFALDGVALVILLLQFVFPFYIWVIIGFFDLHQQAIPEGDTASGIQPRGCPGHPLSTVIHKASTYHHHYSFTHYP